MVERLYTFQEVAAYFGVHESTAARWLRDGILRGFKAGKDWRFTDAHVQACMARLQHQTDTAKASRWPGWETVGEEKPLAV